MPCTAQLARHHIPIPTPPSQAISELHDTAAIGDEIVPLVAYSGNVIKEKVPRLVKNKINKRSRLIKSYTKRVIRSGSFKFLSVLYYNLEIWQLLTLKSTFKQKLLGASAKALGFDPRSIKT